MPTHYRQATATVVLLAATGAFSAATAQTVITTEPLETRTIVRERAPLELSPTQRTTIYRTIVPRGPGLQPIVRERVVTETTGSAVRERVVVDPPIRERVVIDPPARERVVVDPWSRERVVSGTTEVRYVVGDRVAPTVALSPFPERIVREVPAVSRYRYMVADDRVLLVDPVTSTVVEEIVR